MPELEVEGVGTFEVEEGKRPVLAFEEDARVDIMHACGSYAKCSTCRVAYLAGEPEYEVMILDMRDLLGRLGSRARSTPTTTEGKSACEGKRHQRRRLSWRRTRGEDHARAHLDRETLSREAGRRGPRLPRDPESLIISATKGQPGTCAIGSQTGEGGKSKDPQCLRSVSVGPLPSREVLLERGTKEKTIRPGA